MIFFSNHLTNILTFPKKNLYFFHRLRGTRRKSKRPLSLLVNTYGGAMVSTGSLRCWLHVKVNRLAF